MDLVDDSGGFRAPRSDGIQPVPLGAFFPDSGVFGELGEVGRRVGSGREVEVAVDERRGIGHGFSLGNGSHVVGRAPSAQTAPFRWAGPSSHDWLTEWSNPRVPAL